MMKVMRPESEECRKSSDLQQEKNQRFFDMPNNALDKADY